jgi:hypothetical protein
LDDQDEDDNDADEQDNERMEFHGDPQLLRIGTRDVYRAGAQAIPMLRGAAALFRSARGDSV